MNLKPLIIILVILVLVSAGVYIYSDKKGTAIDQDNQVMCTMEAKLCPDGSYVGRSGPKCEFAQCPNTTTPINQSSSNTNASGTIDIYGNVQ